MQLSANSPLLQALSQLVQPPASSGKQVPPPVARQSPTAQQAPDPTPADPAPRQEVPRVALDRNAPRGTYLNVVV